MDFSNRETRPQSAPVSAPAASAAGSRKGGSDNGKWGRIGVVAAVAAITILIVAAIFTVATGGDAKESKYVDTSKLQAVFLNTGQVYFGNVKTLNNKYFVLTNIYYLQTSNNGTTASQNSNANTSVSLVKLGCELHEPLDQMLINRDQVTFWENLGDNGQVATAVAKFKKDNPQGQKCADQSSSASTNSSSSTQSAGSTSSTPAATTPAKP